MSEPVREEPTDADGAAAERLAQARKQLVEQLGRVVVGQADAVEALLIAILCRGHCILEGAPGLAKTLLVSTLARCMNLRFARIQFTPDLMPADITGAEVLEEDRESGVRRPRFIEGPVFTHLLLADEINRAPPRTQAALLESMQERHVTVGRERYQLPDPFLVLATQNPIEQEGTYPLPEAQQDRFMFKVVMRYPSYAEEFAIARRTTGADALAPEPVVSAADILSWQELTRRVPLADAVIRYALALVRQTRVAEADAPEYVRSWLTWGAGPRATQFLLLGAKARALLQNRTHATRADVAALAPMVLRHRVLVDYAAEAEGVTADQVITRIVRETPQHDEDLRRDPRFSRWFDE